MERMTFHRSRMVVAVMAAVLVFFAALWPSPDGWRFVILFIVFYGALTWRQRLVCSAAGVEVTMLATRRLSWADVHGFQPGSSWRGGTRIVTTTGEVWSPAPSSWWGGPASAADLAAIERARPEGMHPSQRLR